MDFAELIARMTGSVAAGDVQGAAACFTADGVYHDVFYGDFTGPAEIERMFAEYFHRDGEDFVWKVHDPVTDGTVGYARYTFSYTSKLPGCVGRRACFEGVAICRLKDGLIADYSEVANAVTGLRLIGFSDARLGKFVDREAASLLRRDEMAPHRR